jgi:phosphoribosyl-AMP cyclohydrolase
MKIDFAKNDGLVPAIIQDINTNKVLMLGYMNQQSFDKTIREKKLHFSAAVDKNYGQKVLPPAMSFLSKILKLIVTMILF